MKKKKAIDTRNSHSQNSTIDLDEERQHSVFRDECVPKLVTTTCAYYEADNQASDEMKNALNSLYVDSAYHSEKVNRVIKIPNSYKKSIKNPLYSSQFNEKKAACPKSIEPYRRTRTILPGNPDFDQCIWVYTIRFNPDGSTERVKTRLL